MTEPSPEHQRPAEPLTMQYLAEHLHFTETPELAATRQALVEAMATNSEHVLEIVDEYLTGGEEIIESQPDKPAKTAARIARSIAMALTRLEAGRIEDGIDDLYSLWDDLDGLIVGNKQEYDHIMDMVAATIREYRSTE